MAEEGSRVSPGAIEAVARWMRRSQLIALAAREGWTELDLSRLALSKLPEEIGRLERLEKLNLSGNGLTSLPEFIGRLEGLEVLNLSSNELTSLPKSIGRLTNLRELVLGVNQLTVLPASIGQLGSLRTLDLDMNQLTALPEFIGQLANLRELSLVGNRLTSLPASLGRCSELQKLDLRDNGLSSLPGCLGYLRELSEIELQGNYLNPALRRVYGAGIDELKAYLRTLPDEKAWGGGAVAVVAGSGRIFLCYARQDRERVESLYRSLEGAGFQPWMDTQDILPGEAWDRRIQQALRDSDFFLACLSEHSVTKRGYVQREIRRALDQWEEMLEDDIYLIPVRLADCDVPDRLARFQWVNLYEDDGWGRLVAALEAGMARRAGGGV